ncbi:hypothetical protein Tco_0382199 [Tanacetum coccineum]
MKLRNMYNCGYLLKRRKVLVVPGNNMGDAVINMLTMEQYLALTSENQALGVVKPEIVELQKVGWIDYLQERSTPEIYSKMPSFKGIVYHPKWLSSSRSTSKRVSNDSSDGIASITNKLDSLGRDMKKVKENMHAIQVGCENYRGAYLNKDCPIHKDAKSVKEVKYGEFGDPFQIITGTIELLAKYYQAKAVNEVPDPSVASVMTSNNVTFIASFIPSMKKVIKGEFKKLESLKISDVSLTCNTSLKIFIEEFNRMSRMDDDLFTYKVEIAEVTNIPCNLKMEDDPEQQMSHEYNDDMEYDPFDVEFTECLASKIFNYKTMDHYTMKALWIHWTRGDDEVELTDEESSDSEDEDEVAKNLRIETNAFDFKTPLCRAFKKFNYLLQIDPDLLTEDIEGFETYADYKDD